MGVPWVTFCFWIWACVYAEVFILVINSKFLKETVEQKEQEPILSLSFHFVDIYKGNFSFYIMIYLSLLPAGSYVSFDS